MLTFNLLTRSHAAGERRHEVVKRALGELRPDVVALQEVTRTADLDQAADLLGPDVTIVDHPGATRDGEGACLASRWPVGDVHKPSWQLDREDEREQQASPLPVSSRTSSPTVRACRWSCSATSTRVRRRQASGS